MMGVGVCLVLHAGLTAATVMFAMADPFLTRPLPYASEDRLVLIEADELSLLERMNDTTELPALSEWQARQDLFDELAAFTRPQPVRANIGGRPVTLDALAVSANFFDVLGIGAAAAATPHVYGDEIWVAPHATSGKLAGLNLVAGSRLSAPISVDVRGVLPPTFLVPEPTDQKPVDVLLELAPGPIVAVDRQAGAIRIRSLKLVGRLAPGVAVDQVSVALNAAAAPRFRVVVTPLAPAMKARHRALALGAVGAGLLVFVVCTANTLGMGLARGFHRAPQLATIELMGAAPRRILSLLGAEGLWLLTVSTGVTLMVLPWLFRVVHMIVPPSLTSLGGPVVTPRVVAVTLVGGLLAWAAWTSGSVVAWRRAKAPTGERTVSHGPAVRTIRFALMAGQVSVALLLLSGAALLSNSYVRLMTQDTGMDPASLALSVSYAPDTAPSTLASIVHGTLEELRRVPGVARSAAMVGQMADRSHVTGLVVLERPVPIERVWVSPGYFDVIGMSFVEGRPLVAADADRSAVVVNEAFGRRWLADRLSVGDTLAVGGVPSTVVGIVMDSQRSALDEVPRPAIFQPLDDNPPPAPVTYVVRGRTVELSALEAAVRRTVPQAEILDGSTIRTRLARTIQDRTFATFVVAAFALATAAITCAGLLAVVGYLVARRTREVGIRMALGARPLAVMWLLMRDAAWAIAAGVTIGLAASLWLSESISNLVYGISPADIPSLLSATALLSFLATAAAAIPARRAVGMLPTEALRSD